MVRRRTPVLGVRHQDDEIVLVESEASVPYASHALKMHLLPLWFGSIGVCMRRSVSHPPALRSLWTTAPGGSSTWRPPTK